MNEEHGRGEKVCTPKQWASLSSSSFAPIIQYRSSQLSNMANSVSMEPMEREWGKGDQIRPTHVSLMSYREQGKERKRKREREFSESVWIISIFLPVWIGHAIKKRKQQLSLILFLSWLNCRTQDTSVYDASPSLEFFLPGLPGNNEENESERQFLSSLIATGQNKTGKATRFLLVW